MKNYYYVNLFTGEINPTFIKFLKAAISDFIHWPVRSLKMFTYRKEKLRFREEVKK